MRPQIINFSLTGIVVCLFVLVGYAAVDLVPCDKTRRVFTNSWGVITDGPIGSNYTQDSHCEWLIKANDTKKFITLSFRSMGTECSYDYVFVYDGDSFRSPLLGSFSGKTEPQQVIASSGYMLVLLYSDTNYVLDGFRAEFSITDCPNNCSNHGLCYEHTCVCESDDWGGYDCSKKLCPHNCGSRRHPQRGHCVKGQCVCKPGYSGQSCSLYESDNVGNQWHWLSHSEGGLQPRAAHTAVYIESTDSLYVFGGYNLNRILSDLEIYSFRNSTWRDDNGQILPDKELVNSVSPSAVARLIQHAGPDWEQKWGLNSPKSFFRNSLYAVVNDNATLFTRRRQRHSRLPDGHKPKARYGHSACGLSDGFVIFGGKLENGSLSNDLWFYNVHSRKWHQRALLSELQPPPLTRHTLTAAGDDIYLFGGSTEDGEFSSRLFRIRLQFDSSETWEEIKPRGGKELDVRVVAHTTVYHPPINSLLVYGGIVAGVARFSKLSDRMFAFQLDSRHWTEIHYTREHLREKYVPRERAFHTANIFGNYLIVFGGYSHRHNKEEICYDNQMYLYHLGCHTWVNPEILGKTNDSRYPKHQGVFAHAASIRNGNTLLLVGGYHGNVNGDLLAYTVPPMIASRNGETYDPESACIRHRNYGECSADPECGWCSADELCYGRTIGANCTTNLQTTRCPGVCPALGDCHSCLIHGHVRPDAQPLVSASHKLGLGECTWCVQNARCHHKDDNYGVCGLREDSPSQIPGWWGPKGTEVVEPKQCRELDMRPGLTFVKYHHPVNFTQPDHVAIINATTVDFNSPTSPMLRVDATAGGEMVARLLGFLCLPSDWQEMLNVCISYCSATLKISDNLIANVSAENKNCTLRKWPINETSNNVSVDFESHKVVNLGAYNSHQQSKMELQHHRDSEDTPKVFTFEYLKPYANGTCSQYKNCLYCLTDSQCGWCEANNECVSRLEDESISCTGEDGYWRYLTLQPSACSNCSNFISCESCVTSGLCQWSIEDAKCSRVVQKAEAAKNVEQCPTPCYKRPDCTSCLEQKGRCVWCEATQQCFSFSVYTSEYQFGLCREWLDQAFPLVTAQDNSLLPAPRAEEQCKSCSMHANCSHCLSSLSCGWCYNVSNPMTGMCVQGDFNNPHVNCSEALGLPDAKWAYAQCPDVDECGLGLHDCHPQAICTNTDGSFSCHCKKGYQGNGRTSCIRTCYNVCVHGKCQGEPDYACKCNLGWYGDDCSKNCGCNNHSACPEGEGICEECMEWTKGEFCEECKPGSYGNATTEQGCHQCECNGHGIKEAGECDNVTGTCYCQDNTEGDHCERCKLNYYGDPRNGKQCYYQCEARGVLDEAHGQGISSMQAYTAPWGGSPTRECLWIIKPAIGSPIIQLQINSSQLNVTCGENAVYVYDGLPELVDMGSQSALSAAFCTEEALPVSVVESRTGQLTVHYKQGLIGEGFSAMYKVLSCDDICESPRVCARGQCVCEEGLVGFNCEEVICPRNCSFSRQQGVCDKAYGRCICASGWVGPSCDIRANGTQVLFTELFNTIRLSDNVEHLRKTLPRFGHSLASDRRGSLWMFGGYSLSHGPLNDIRLFDTRNSTWMQVTVDSTTLDAKMPLIRYFHGADIIHSKQAIYVYGGLTKPTKGANNRTLDDFWQFDIQNQRWGEIEKNKEWPPPLSSHTLTSYRNATAESLILIGGISPQNDFHNVVWEFRVDKEEWQAWTTRGQGPKGIFGHSTVFHAPTNGLYVFGGYVYEQHQSRLSNKLFVLNYDTKVWTELNELSAGTWYLPRPRFFHSAVSTDNFMFVMGGRIFPWNISDTLYAYSYNCNRWINLMSEALEKVGPLPTQTYAQAMTIEPDGDAAYIIGGWGTDSQCSVLRLELPDDLCSLWPTRDSCFRMAGCGYCAYKVGEDILSEVCHSNVKECPLQESPVNASKVTNSGTVCTEPVVSRNCSSMTNCTSCVQIGCRFCDNTCTANATCSVTTVNECSPNNCSGKEPEQCRQTPGCDWNCSKGECTALLKGQEESPKVCPQPCVHYNTCSSCLEVNHCRWSTQLDECISAAYQPAYCAGGVCGLVLQADDKQYCPAPCSSFTQCSDCLVHAHCGWCARPGNGEGICTEGSNDRPMHGTCNDVYLKSIVDIEDADFNETYTWHWKRCPPEDECTNGHHNCASESQRCVDRDDGFECECGSGYKPTNSTKVSTASSVCEPVCTLGCVRGQCVQPNKCQCDFGYVGANCSIQCQCNGHANCEGPDKLDKCLTCHNNTMGTQCEKCKPLFVGDPSDGGQCMPCLEYCNGHTSICVDNSTELDFEEYLDVESERFLKNLKEGPKAEARCLKCSNQTAGNRCQDCIVGNFRGTEDHRDSCKPCECHGHGDTCDPVTGDKCNCKNNTESDVCGGSGKNSASPCWRVQCSKCKEGYLGTPTAGHQCYKQMSVDSKMCFDAKPIDECKIKPKALSPGEMVFFVIQPRFMNVDIRIMIDVTQGNLNVYMSTHDDTYIAYPNATTGLNSIDLDGLYGHWENGTQKTKDAFLEHEAVGLRTYITITQPNTILAVKNLRDRLVITLPEEYHSLESTRFFLVLQALDTGDSEKKAAYGIVFSRQDQLHIDLFVFFSVFFSCFFLFLAACVVAWKAKQAADVRRARRRHVVEMLHMAKRPFASVTLNLSTRSKPKKSAHCDLRPVAVEPTDDGLAAVATVFVSLPGGQSPCVKLALASSLILLVRQFPTGGRTFLRRRSAHAAPPT